MSYYVSSFGSVTLHAPDWKEILKEYAKITGEKYASRNELLDALFYETEDESPDAITISKERNSRWECICDETFLDSVARYAEPGSYLLFVGEDGEVWEYLFDGKEVYSPEVILPHQRPLEEWSQ